MTLRKRRARKANAIEFAAERSWLQKTFQKPGYGPEFIMVSFRLGMLHMPRDLLIRITQNVTEIEWAILVALVNGPQSIRGLAKMLNQRLEVSRKTVSQGVRDLLQLDLVECRKGRGKNYCLSSKIIPYLFLGLREAWEIRVES